MTTSPESERLRIAAQLEAHRWLKAREGDWGTAVRLEGVAKGLERDLPPRNDATGDRLAAWRELRGLLVWHAAVAAEILESYQGFVLAVDQLPASLVARFSEAVTEYRDRGGLPGQTDDDVRAAFEQSDQGPSR